jgi:hypothetical protein
VTDSGPTVEITLEALADNYADSMYPNSAYGNRPILYVGNSYDRAQNLSGPARIYIQFNLSAIPRHARVVSAEMSLYQMYAPASDQALEMHMVQSVWNESTMNWKTQPSSDAAVISAAQAPAIKDAWVSWNVTSAVQRWVNGDSPNYGFMIQIQNEKTGAANEASGFWSRQYPKEQVKPKLRVFCQNNPPFTYLSTVRMSGLPAELSSVVTADDTVRVQVSGEGATYFLFESGTTHVISVDEYVNAGESVRYRAKSHSIAVNASDAEFTFSYEPQFLIIVKSEPAGLIQREWSDWYDRGTGIETPLAREVAYNGSDMRILFDAWYMNGDRESGNPIHFTVNGPATVVARYATTYNITVSSPFGTVLGSGWHAAGSSVEISVTPTYVPDEGIPGYLGLGMTFDHWSGSVDSTSSKTTITVNGPIQAKAVWREDRSRFLLGVAIIAGLALLLATLRRRAKRRPPGDRLRKMETRNSSRLLRRDQPRPMNGCGLLGSQTTISLACSFRA